ncbi:hypothetical protein [Cryobacterium luteum]|uniref:Uncharacterized protein n=1 Tax=Cryobacterium luteum TaxID=1424661 RepID=A0A1H8GDT0_9MICO|nr:hypothetical protein [Cryobacterium luteum]TFB93949.1 hypothetical protein E3O10_02860 [Cryobacterium luteum]SEN42143.1 hypothetical protein SAMN05216281_107145 [Cryobacterium luteum]
MSEGLSPKLVALGQSGYPMRVATSLWAVDCADKWRLHPYCLNDLEDVNEIDESTILNFSSTLIKAQLLDDAVGVILHNSSIIVNAAPSAAYIEGSQISPLPPLSSTILRQGKVTGEKLIVLQLGETGVDESGIAALGWANFYGDSPDAPVLLKSAQDELGYVEFDSNLIPGQLGDSRGSTTFGVRANLWFSPKGTDCGIHNEHDFIEVHTQIHGYGRMQKFMENEAKTVYEDQLLSPGNTNPTPFCREAEGAFQYPWHQYRADTDCVWLAIEYHRN